MRGGADVDFQAEWAHVRNQEHQVSPRGASDWWRESVRKSVSVHQDKIRGSAIQQPAFFALPPERSPKTLVGSSSGPGLQHARRAAPVPAPTRARCRRAEYPQLLGNEARVLFTPSPARQRREDVAGASRSRRLRPDSRRCPTHGPQPRRQRSVGRQLHVFGMVWARC